LPIAPNSFIAPLLVLKKSSTVLLCGLAIAGQLRAQEVVVAREPKSNAPERVAPLSKVTDLESETATQTKFQVREKKSASPTLTVEQMRKAGALAADRQKKEFPVETTNIGRVTHFQPRKSEPAAIRPTMIESQSEEPASSPPAKAERSGMRTNPAQSASVPLRKKETLMSHPVNSQLHEADPIPAPSVNMRTETAFTKLANGFDFPH
jgi:hypothetical protein